VNFQSTTAHKLSGRAIWTRHWGKAGKSGKFIVVDDGSTERKPFALLERVWEQDFVHPFKGNCGVALARNGPRIEQAKGDYVRVFPRRRRRVAPEKLEIPKFGVLRSMPDVGVLGGGSEWKKGGGKEGFSGTRRLREVSLESLLFRKTRFCTSTVVCPTSILRESSLRSGRSFKGPRNWHLWIRLAGRTRLLERQADRCRGHYLTEESISRRDLAFRLTGPPMGRCTSPFFSNSASTTPQYSPMVRPTDGMTN